MRAVTFRSTLIFLAGGIALLAIFIFADAASAPTTIKGEEHRDFAADSENRPVIVYTRLPSESDHRYHYARWTGISWDDHEICAAGPWFPRTPEGKTEPEPHYSGGIALDHNDPSAVYLSRRVDGVFEIERRQTRDGGATWTVEAVTAHSSRDNVRPFVIRNHPRDGPAVLWMSNASYVHYTSFRTSIKFR